MSTYSLIHYLNAKFHAVAVSSTHPSNASNTHDILVTCWRLPRRICYEEVMRKQLPWNLGLTMHIFVHMWFQLTRHKIMGLFFYLELEGGAYKWSFMTSSTPILSEAVPEIDANPH